MTFERKEIWIAPDDAQRVYELGFGGAFWSAKDSDDLTRLVEGDGGDMDAEEVCHQNGLFGAGEGKLSLAYMAAEQLYPGCLPGGAQERGDCVSWSTRNTTLGSYCNEILFGNNSDRHDAPTLSDAQIKGGVLSTESFYWWRGYDGDGWTCAAAANVAIAKSGMWIRQNYPEFGVDLTKYSPRTAGRWGRTPPPEAVKLFGQKTLVKTATRAKGYDEVRDLLATGNCLSTCGSEAFGDRDANGVCRRKAGTWAHAIACMACDDRQIVKDQYKTQGLLLFVNSWGNYLKTGSRKILGTELLIPEGSFWARWEEVQDRYFIALSASVGWPGRTMPNWGLGGILQ